MNRKKIPLYPGLFVVVHFLATFFHTYFFLGVPPDIVGKFNYFNPDIEFERVPLMHPSFINTTTGM